MNKRNITINAALVFILGTLWQQTLHELGHFVAGKLLNAKDGVLYHNYVSHDLSALTVSDRILVAAAGPLFSLFIGVLFQGICSMYSRRNYLFLFFLYMSAFGYINFGGYLLVSPFFKGGDTGFIFAQLHFPAWLTYTCALAGCVLLYFFMKMISRYFVEMATPEIIQNKASRKAFLTLIIENPLYIGIAVTLLLNLPVITVLSLLYPACSPFTFYWIFGHLYDYDFETSKANTDLGLLNKLSWPLIGFFIASVVINRLLVYGFSF